MAAINAAWDVLSDPRRRAEYDAQTAPPKPVVERDEPPLPTTADSGGLVVSVRTAALLKWVPRLVAVFGVLALLVVTALARSPADANVVIVGDCIAFEGPGSYDEVGCGGDHDGRVVQITFDACAPGLIEFQPRSVESTFCLEPRD